MENWESVLRTEQRKHQAYLRCEKEKFWTRLLTQGLENGKAHIFQQIEHGIAEYSAVYRLTADLASQDGLPEIIPDETVMIPKLVRGILRRLHQKYMPVPAARPAPGELEMARDIESINIPDNSDPTSPVSPSGFDRWAASNIKVEVAEEQPDLAATGQNSDSAPNAWTRHPQPSLDGPSRQACANSKKRTRVGNGPYFAETIAAEPTELGSIHCQEVENQEWIFSHDRFPGFLFVIRCDRASERSHTTHIFPTHPLKYSRAATHFSREKQKDFKCHGEEVCGAYTDMQLIIKFGYRVYGDELEDPEWVMRSNQNAEKSGWSTRSSPTTYTTRSGTQQTGVGDVVRTGERAARGELSSGGYSTTSQLAGSSSTKRARRPGPEFGPARRSRQDSSPYASGDSSSRLKLGDANTSAAPIPEMRIFDQTSPEQGETRAQPVIHASPVVHVATTRPGTASLPKASTSQGQCSASGDFDQNNLVVSDLVPPFKK